MKHSPMQGSGGGGGGGVGGPGTGGAGVVRHPDDHSGAGSINDINSFNHFADGSVNLF